MSAAQDRPGGPAFVMPPNQRPGGLGLRVLAAFVDGLVPALISTGYAAFFVSAEPGSSALLVLGVAAVIGNLAWGVYVWWSGGERAATPGMRLVDLEIVGIRDGRQIGWGRFFARQFAVSALSATGIGLPLMLIWLVLDDNHRGWHDKLAQAVVIARPRREAEEVEDAPQGDPQARVRRRNVVGLPPHLAGASSFGPSAGTGPGDPGMPQIGPPRESMPSAGPQHSGGPGQPAGPQQRWEPPQHSQAQPHQAQPQPAQFQQAQPQQAQPQQAQPQQAQPHQGQPHQGQPQQVQPHQFGPQGQPAQPAWENRAPHQQTPQQQAQNQAPQQAGPQQPPRHQPTANLPPHLAHQLQEQPYVAQPWQPGPGRQSAEAPVRGDDRGQAGVENPDLTVLVPGRGAGRRPITDGWVLVLEDGREVPIRPTVLLGRFPTPEPDEEVAELIAVDEGARMVSKTHLLVGVDNRGVYLVDRNSRNGSSLVDEQGQQQRLRPGEPARVNEGQVISFGDRRLAIRRTTS